MYHELIQQFLAESGNNLTRDEQFALLVHAFMIKKQYVLKQNSQTTLANLHSKSSPYVFNYQKEHTDFDLTLKKEMDEKFKIILSGPNKKVEVTTPREKYMKNIPNIDAVSEQNLQDLDKFLSSIMTDSNSSRDFSMPTQNPPLNQRYVDRNNYGINAYPGSSNLMIGGINDFGPIPPSSSGFGPFGPAPFTGNLMGPDNFPFQRANPYARYEPITPFGPNFDFYPQQDSFNHFGPGSGNFI